MKEKIKEMKTKINNIVYKIKKKIYDIIYRRITYIPEKGLWVSTVVFPSDLSINGKTTICGVTDVFEGNEKKVYFDSLYTVYLNKPSESSEIHRKIVKLVRCGYFDREVIRIKSGLDF